MRLPLVALLVLVAASCPRETPQQGEGEGEGEGDRLELEIPPGTFECSTDDDCADGACARNNCGSVCTSPALAGGVCNRFNNENECADLLRWCAAGLECAASGITDEPSACVVPRALGEACGRNGGAKKTDGCEGDLICSDRICRGDFTGCDPRGEIESALCEDGEICATLGFSDEGPSAFTVCGTACISDATDDDGCGPDEACVVAGCSRSLICLTRGSAANCQDGGEGEGEPDVGGPPGVACVDDSDCGDGVCGGFHRCFDASCITDDECEPNGCATASRDGATCGSSCFPRRAQGEPCRFVSASGCDTVVPCAAGLVCDEATGTCL